MVIGFEEICFCLDGFGVEKLNIISFKIFSIAIDLTDLYKEGLKFFCHDEF